MVIGTTSILTAVAALVAVLGLIWLAGRVARFGGMARRPADGAGACGAGRHGARSAAAPASDRVR